MKEFHLLAWRRQQPNRLEACGRDVLIFLTVLLLVFLVRPVLAQTRAQDTLRADSADITTESGDLSAMEKNSKVPAGLRPPGDDFNNPIVETGYDWQTNGSIAYATLQNNEPKHPGRRVTGSIWYRWTAPGTGPVELNVSFPESIRIDVFVGSKLGKLKRVPLFSTVPWFLTFNAVAGTTYQIAVYHMKMPSADDGSLYSVNLGLRTIAIATPSAGATPTDIDTVHFTIQSLEPVTNIVNVVYEFNGMPLATNDTPPFDVSLTGFYPSDWTVTATATLNSSLTVESAPVSFHVLLSNDYFTNAAVLTGTDISTRAWLAGATYEPGEPQPVDHQKSAWWVWTAPSTGRVWIDFDGTNGMPFLEVYSGTTVDALTVADWFWRQNISHLELNCVAGTKYYIFLASDQPYAGTLRLKVLAPPDNDLFVNRTAVSGTNLVLEGSLVEATEEPGEPVPPYGCGYTGRSAWWSWTAPTNNGVAMIDARLTTPCVRMAAFTGDTLTNLTNIATGEENWMQFETQPGQTYQIMMDNSQEINPLTATLTFTPAPTNDYFIDRVPLEGSVFTVTTPILGAGLETNEPPHQERFGMRSVWYQWTAPASGNVMVTSLSTFPMAIVDVYQGDSFETLQSLNVGWNPQTFYAQAGVTYYIAVGGFGFNFFEPASLLWELQPSP